MFQGMPQNPPPWLAASMVDGKNAARSSAGNVRREVEQPPGAGELGDPDDVHHEDVEAGATALEIDDVELVLLVGVPGQDLACHPHPGMPRLELAEQVGESGCRGRGSGRA